MSEPQKPDESQDESLASVPPTPMTTVPGPQSSNLALGAVILTAAGAGAILLIAGTMTPAAGATRSTKLEWEERKLQIEQAECDAQLDSKVDVKSDAQSDVAEQG
jgi:hypothetical protein